MSATLLAIIPAAIDLIRKFIPDRDKQIEAEREFTSLVSDASAKLGDAMKIDAASPDKFNSRWRPALGWIGVVGSGLEFLIFPLVNMILGLLGKLPLESTLDPVALGGMVATVLGIGTLRTYEKKHGKAS